MMADKRKTSNLFRKILKESRLLLISLGFVVLTVLITGILYLYTQEILKNRLRERLLALVSTAAVQFDASDIIAIRGEESVSTPEFEKLVNQLQAIREANKNIQYAYLMRRTTNPDIVEFVADADSLATDEELDADESGHLDDSELPPWPGDPYEVVNFPVLRDQAFYEPSVDRNLQPDQWGLIMAAYAPIFDDQGEVVAIIGIDVLVDDFNEVTRATLLPFLLLVLFLISALVLLTLILMRVYTERVEIVQELDRQKDELLGIVSHQLAKPITAIKWNIESLMDGDAGELNKEQREAATTMQTMATDLSDLTSMILDVSRVQLGRMKLNAQPLDLNEFLKEIMSIIEPTIEEKKINFVKRISPKKLPTVLLDKRYTRMTVENLLTNAVKYTPEKGTVTLDIEIKNGTLYCKVIDTGIGIPKAEQQKIFGKMYRASNAQNTHEGNGFGLYVAKGAIEGQGGKIGFTSEEGKGTTFWFELPIKEV